MIVVERDQEGRVVPALDQLWSELDRLQWKCAVTKMDCNFVGDLHVSVSDYSTKRLGSWVREKGYFDIHVGYRSIGPYRYHEAWAVINGIDLGLKSR